MKRHPDWMALMARPLDPEVAAHVQGCPQCRVDRRRLLVEPPAFVPPEIRRRFETTHERIARELLPAVRTALARLPRHGRRDRLPPAGTAFGPYRAVGVLGRGETSLVLLGVHERHGTRHALKIVRTRDPGVRRQVSRERQVQDELHHPLLVPVLDSVDAPTGQAVLVLEFVDGPSLAKLLRSRATLPWPWIDAIAIDVLRGIEALHQAGWVHRDLNPGNVLLDPNPRFRARIADFGRAMLQGTASDGPPAMPLYVAPEQLDPGNHADARSDVFALGTLLYELVTHQRCFAGLDAGDVARRVREVVHIPVSKLRPDTPTRIAEAIEAALTLDLEARPARAAELLDLWTRGAGAASRPGVELTGAEWAALRSMRTIERLPEARSALTPTTVPEPTGTIPALTRAQIEAEAHARPKLPRWLRHGRWAAILGTIALVGIVTLATRTPLEPVAQPPPTETWLDRDRVGVIDPDLARTRRTLVYSDGQDLWVGPLDGSTPWTLTGAFPLAATEPTWSWDHGSVAFTAPDGIYTIDLRLGDDPVPVVPWARDPTWSPDGSRIVFVNRPREGQPEALRVWDRWTQEVVTLLEEPGLANPTFSPDGSRIALETGQGLEVLGVGVDGEGRVALERRRAIAPGDTAPCWLSDTSLAAWRDDGGAPGGRLVRWTEVAGGWRDREMLATSREVRSFEVGPDERWFVLGLTDPEPTILRIERSDEGTITPAYPGSAPRIGPARGLAYQTPDGAIRWLDSGGDLVADVPAPVSHWGFGPDGGLLVYREAGDPPVRDWFVLADSGLQVSELLGGLPLEGRFAASGDGRFLAAQLSDGHGPVLLDLVEPLGPQLDAARQAPWPGEAVAGLSPDGVWLLVVDDGGFALVDRLTGEVAGPPLEGLGAAFVDDETLALVRADEVVLVDRATRVIQERYPLHPYEVPAQPDVVATAAAIWVDGIVEHGGLLRLDRLTGPARP